MSPEEWRDAWGVEHLVFANDQAGQLSESARQFLHSFGLPRFFTFNSAADERNEWRIEIAFGISFEQLSRELVRYGKFIDWGDLYDEQLDEAWSQQLEIGEIEYGQPYANLCVHQTSATVTHINCENESEPELFVNSSVPQFCKSLLVLKQWSLASRTATVDTWNEVVLKLVEDLRNVDPDAFQHEKSFWPYQTHNIRKFTKPGSVEITFDPTPEFLSKQRWIMNHPGRSADVP